MADHGVALAVLDDLPARGQTVSGETAAAYRCARRLLQPTGGLADCIESAEGVEWPEENYRSVDLREWLGKSITAADLRALEVEIAACILEEQDVDDVDATVEFASGMLSASVEILGADGPFSFVLAVSDVSGATLQVT